MSIWTTGLIVFFIISPLGLNKAERPPLASLTQSLNQNAPVNQGGRSIASEAPSKAIETDGQDDSLVTTLNDLQQSYKQSIILAATAEELRSLANVEVLIQNRAHKLCEEIGAKNGKSYHKCRSFQIAEVDDNSTSAMLPVLSQKQLRVSKASARARRLKPESKSEYCKTNFATEHDQQFCGTSNLDSEGLVLKPRRFTEITCLLQNQPFPVERRRVLAHPSGRVSPKQNSSHHSVVR